MTGYQPKERGCSPVFLQQPVICGRKQDNAGISPGLCGENGETRWFQYYRGRGTEPLKILYQQPMIIMIYLLARDYAAESQEKWYSTQDMLGMVFSDLEINPDY